MKVTATVPLRITPAPIPGGPWAPVRDADGNIKNYADLPARTWTEIPGTKMEDTIKPILDAGGYTLYTHGDNKLSATMDNYAGAAFDSGGRMWFYGGGHYGGSDNGVYGIDLNKMLWSITSYPTHPTKDMTPEQTRFYGLGSHYAAFGVPHENPYILPLANSSTGFAVKYGGFSSLSWWEVKGPEGRANANTDPIFPNGDTWSKIANHSGDFRQAFGNVPNQNIGDVLFDGRPATRHTYGGFLYSPKADLLISAVRCHWICKLDGTGWVKLQDGGAKVPEVNRISYELLWTQIDEKTGKVWRGGCGSDCFNSGYFYYSAAMIFDPVTMTETESGNLLPDKVHFSTGGFMVNAGDIMVLPFKAGRKIGGWCKTGYGWTYDLDTAQRMLVVMVGEPYSGSTGEGRSTCYISHLGQLWAFDTNKWELPLWTMDMANPQPGGTEGAYKVVVKKENLAGSEKLPSNNNGLVYTRLQFWEKHKLIVYFPGTRANAWVCRVP